MVIYPVIKKTLSPGEEFIATTGRGIIVMDMSAGQTGAVYLMQYWSLRTIISPDSSIFKVEHTGTPLQMRVTNITETNRELRYRVFSLEG